MFLTELVRIYRVIPDITEKNFAKIDNFFGEIGTNEIFARNDLLREITQKSMIDRILEFLLNEKIITPYNQQCPMCGKEQILDNSLCEECGANFIEKKIQYYRIIADLNVPYNIKQINDNKKKLLDLTAFRILLKKIESKKRNNRNGTIILIDIANSMSLGKNNQYLSALINSRSITYASDIMRKYFRQSKGILFKSDGDSSLIYFNENEDAQKFLLEFKENLEYQDFFKKIVDYNSENDTPVYYKIFIAESEVIDYMQKDLISLDFSSLEAIVFISRIEKKSKPALISKYKDEGVLFPFFIISRDKRFSENSIKLNGVNNYGDVTVYYTLEKEFK